MPAPSPREPSVEPGNAVTAVLVREHGWICEALELLEQVVGRLNAGTPVEVGHLLGLVSFFREFADRCHHAKEEDVLFPVLLEAGVLEAGSPLAPVANEHEQGRRLVRTLEQHAVDAGKSAEARDRFVHAALAYVALLRDHITHENEVLFPLADELLGEDVTRIVAAFDLYESHAVGENAAARFRAQLDALTKLLTA